LGIRRSVTFGIPSHFSADEIFRQVSSRAANTRSAARECRIEEAAGLVLVYRDVQVLQLLSACWARFVAEDASTCFLMHSHQMAKETEKSLGMMEQ
jgi:hypothetical protein